MNIAQLLDRSAQRVPQRTAWIHGDTSATYERCRARVASLAGGLRESGLARGDRVVLVLPNGPDLFDWLWASFWAGCTAVPVNRHLNPHEVSYVVEHCSAAMVVVATETASAAEHLDSKSATRVILTGSTDDGALRDGPPSTMCQTGPEDAAWLFYTSGTTGRPKGATLTHANLLAMTLNYYADLDPVADDAVFLHAAPLTHGSGLYLLPAIGHGAVNVISADTRFDADNYLRLAQRYQVTHAAFLAPTMLRRIVDAEARSHVDLPCLRSVVVGGAPLYVQDLRDAIATFGPIITQMYGQGEAPMTISVMRADELPTHLDAPRWQSCGRPFSGVEVLIDSPEGGPGEILVRGDVVMSGYWADPVATARTLGAGWLHTGDIGHVDEHGYLYVTDRAKDVIITGGSNVYPREVEEVLTAHPDVIEAAVVGLPDDEWGEAVCAFVSIRAGATLSTDDIVNVVTARLASFKKPRRVVFVEQLPKSGNGKVLKRVLCATD